MSTPEENERDKPKAHSVEGGVIRQLSVSQLQTADSKSGGCIRAWYFDKVLHLPRKPPGAGQVRGTEGHRRIEWYLREEQDVLSPMEREGVRLGHIPKPGKDLLVEEHFGKPTPLYAQGIPMTGYMDLVNPRHLGEGLLRIVDWKFKASIENYACRPADLINPENEAGIQMLGYGGGWASVARDRFALKYDTLELVHVTFQTKGRVEVDCAPARISLTAAERAWDTVSRRIVPRMVDAAKAEVFTQLPAEGEENGRCDKYGGCDFRATCLDRMKRLAAGFRGRTNTQQHAQKEDRMGFLSTMTGSPPTTPTPPAIAAPAPAQAAQARRLTMVDESTPTEVRGRDCTQGASYLVNGEVCKFVCTVAMAGTSYASFSPAKGGPPVMLAEGAFVTPLPLADKPPLVLPPDAPKSDPALAARPAPGTVAVPPPAPEAPKAKAAPEAPKRGPGRPKKEKAEAAPAPEAAKAEAPVVAAPAPIITSPAPAPQALAQGVQLFINCSPIGVACQNLAAYVEGVDQALQKAAQVQLLDIRTANDNALGFGKWKAYFAKQVQESPPAPGRYMAILGGDERVDVAVSTLAQILPPGSVVMGGR